MDRAEGGVDLAFNPKRGRGPAEWKTELNLEPFLEKWGNALLATARRYSPTPTDADDVYQRAVEILLSKAPDHESEEHRIAWMQTVVRNEALQLHRSSKKIVDAEFDKISEALIADDPTPDEAFELEEELSWGREALARIRPDQTRCLLLKADGMSNPEICEVTGFSYAKVNRLLSEGRTALGVKVSAISGGRECERIEPLLLLMADDVAEPEAVSDANLHLEHCSACRATLRDLREAPSSLAALFPVGTVMVADSQSRIDQVVGLFQRVHEALQAKFSGYATSVQNLGEVSAAKKAAVAVGATATLIGGGAAVNELRENQNPQSPPAVVRPALPATPTAEDLAARAEQRERRARVAERREQRVTEAEAARRAQASEQVPDAEPLGQGTQVDRAAADPADDVSSDAPTSDGRDTGLAP